MTRQWAILEPLDTIVIRDGRPFDAGNDSVASCTWPRPSTVAGAVSAFLAKDPDWLRGPILVRRDSAGGPLPTFWPCPRDIVYNQESRSYQRLAIKSTDSEAVITDVPYTSLPTGTGDEVETLIEGKYLASYLRGEFSGMLTRLAQSEAEFFDRESLIGLWKDGGTAVDGYLYAGEQIRLRNAYALATLVGEDAVAGDDCVVPFGGEGRYASATLLSEDRVQTPILPDELNGERLLLYLATPGVFSEGWRPPLPETAEIVTACISGPEPICVWRAGETAEDGSRHPSGFVTYWAVGPGSVYYLRFDSPEEGRRFARETHGKALAPTDPDLERIATAGFGYCFVGEWS